MGRAGRAGQPSISVLFYSPAELKGSAEATLKALCDQGENCHRRMLLKGLGSSEMVTTESRICCDVCEPVCPYKDLTFPRVPEARKTTLRKRALPQNTRQMMESELLAQRDAVVEGNPALKMFPKSVFCPLNVIQDVCSKSSSVKCIHDMQSFSCLRKELHSPFFTVITSLRSGHLTNFTCSHVTQ